MRTGVLGACLAVTVFAAGCSGGEGSHVVSMSGRVGNLRVDRSDRSDVIRFAGRPRAERRTRYLDRPPYDALGYGCSKREHGSAFPLATGRTPYCATVFWLDRRSGRLEDFYTTSRQYSESHGVRIGMRSGRVERRLHQPLYAGCEEDIHLASPRASLTVAFDGGVVRREGTALHVLGARVYALVLHSRRRGSGVFDCL